MNRSSANVASAGEVRLLRRPDVIEALHSADVLGAIRDALIASARGRVIAPAALSFDFRTQRGEAHVKGAYLEGASNWAVKVATGFYGNPERGLPTASGMSLVASSETGVVQTIIVDGGHLTDVRTAAAGALAIDALATDEVEQLGIVGCGIQARVQLEYLLRTRRPGRVVVFGRRLERAERCAAEMRESHGVEAVATDQAREAVRGSDVVLTVTPAESPIVDLTWLEPRVAIVAVGSDMAGKQELDVGILREAALIVADDPAQASRVGELQHSSEAAARAQVLGEILEAPISRDGGIAVCDLTGLGVEDAAIAGLVAEQAGRAGLGETISIG